MKIVFSILLAVHGLIHLMGFVKGLGIADIKELTQPVTKFMGIIWFAASVLFFAVLLQYALKNEFWWFTAIIAVVVSQVLVIIFWHDAKFGTIPNIIILLVAIVVFARFSYTRSINHEIDNLFSRMPLKKAEKITTEMIVHLPVPVQKWMENSGIVGKDRIYTVRLKQRAQMKLKPEQKEWTDARAEQYYTIEKPAFIWRVDMQMMPLINVMGRDKFLDGKGEMQIKLLSLIPIVNEADNEQINTGAMLRYLGEIVWFPSAALSPDITWQYIDETSAQATLSYQETAVSGVFFFNEQGEFIKFSAQRYLGGDKDAELREWIITATESKMMNGIIIPAQCEATWKLETGDWTWLKIEITDIAYNTAEKY